MFSGVYGISLSIRPFVCPSVCRCVCLCTKYWFLSKHWWAIKSLDGSSFSSENTVGKGEIARYEQFLLFSFSHSVFKRLVSQGRQKASLCGNGLNLVQAKILLSCLVLTHSHTMKPFDAPGKQAF